MTDDIVSVRYMVSDVAEALAFYQAHFGFQPGIVNAPAFAEVSKGNLRLLLSGPTSSAGRPMPDGAVPGPGGWNRLHLMATPALGYPTVKNPCGALIADLRSAHDNSACDRVLHRHRLCNCASTRHRRVRRRRDDAQP